MTTTPPEPGQPFGAGQPPYPGAPPAQPAYGSYPTGPAGAPRQAPPAPAQPGSIALAVKLMWAGAALAVVSLVYTVLTLDTVKDDVRAQMLEADPSVDQATIDAATSLLIGFAFVFGLLGALLWAWMAWKNGQGRGWARIVATVFAGFNLLGLLFTGVGGNAEPISIVLSVVSVILAVIILVLLWRKESTEFYNGTAASRRMY